MATIFDFLKSPRFSRQDLAVALNGLADLQTLYCGITAGSANAQTLTSNLSLDLTVVRKIAFKATYSNTGAMTLNLDGTGALSVVMPDGNALKANMITNGRFYEVIYNGTNYTLMQPTQEWYTWTISGASALGGGSWTGVGTGTQYRFLMDNSVEVRGRILATSTGTITNFVVDLPVTTTYTTDQSISVYALQNGTRVSATGLIDTGADKIYVARYDAGNFTAGANSGFVINGKYSLV